MVQNKSGDIVMAKVFSVASWNVGHFKADPVHVERVAAFSEEQKTDFLHFTKSPEAKCLPK